MDKFKYIGHSHPLYDAAMKAKGELEYGSDLSFPRMLYAKLVLSSIAHGYVKHIDTEKAEALPGVIRVFHSKNSPSKHYSRYRITPKQGGAPEDEVIFPEKVRFIGDRVAAVVAEDPETARRAAALVSVEYKELPAFITPEGALDAGSGNSEGNGKNGKEFVPIHESGNRVFSFENKIGDSSPVRGEEIITETVARTPRIHHAAMETHGCIALYQGDKLTIYSGSQGVYGIRTVIAELFDMPYHKVRIIKVPIGGSFGGRQEAIVEPVASLIAMKLRRPVKLSMDREETIVATMTRPPARTKIRSALSKDGRIMEMKAETLFDVGAYAGSVVDYAYSITKFFTRLYRVPYYRHFIECTYTNTPVTGGTRGWGGPELFAAVETHFFEAAAALGMDPVDLHLKNVVQPGDIDPAKGLSLGNARIKECIEQGAHEFNWRERYSQAPESGRIRRGVGFACVAHKNGMRGVGQFPEHATMVMKMNEDGTCVLNTGLQELGCGICTTIGLIAGEALGIEPSRITVTEADTEMGPYDFGAVGSRVTYNCGACALETAGLLKQKILEVAAKVFVVAREEMIAQDGWAWPKGREDEKKPFSEIAERAKIYHDTDLIVNYTYQGMTNPGAYGAHFAEVAVDTLTGRVEVTDYLAAHDLGKIINRAMVEGQIQGCVQMGIGFALYEEVIIGEDGRTKNNTLREYNVVNAPSMPKIKMVLLEEGGDAGPFGAKSIGEAGIGPVAPAVVNAVNHALRGIITRPLHDFPLYPEKVIAAIEGTTPASPTESKVCRIPVFKG